MAKSITNNQAFNFISNILNDNKYYNQINLFLSICFILLIFHFSSCIYIFIGRNSYPNWIITTNLDNKSFSHIYICGIYILITALTTVGYGDITCYSFKERIFQLILLIIGIVAYSWIVSSLSNYIKKINEQSVDLESRISILDEIKMTNPNLTKDLYDRILRHLKYKKYFKKKDKSIILDSLPVTLKNNLIVEMYKPIIKNFIFFKSFQNTDFIVRVILSFKPILALKNDILVNEGDIVEDIMFVKKGILSVELPLNMENPEENKRHYLKMPILQAENDTNIEKVGSNFSMPEKGSNLRAFNNTLRTSLNKSSDGININNKNISYVRILSIRENEHFGDVLMFLEQRSPLRVRVRTKKAELFFLKKIEAVNISSSYQNIWRRINKKSVFNFEQIKKSILKIVEIYSSYRKIRHEVKENKINKKMRKTVHSFDFRVDKNIFEPLREINIRRLNSQKILVVKNKYSELFEEEEKSDVSSQHKYQSSHTLNLTNSFYTNKSSNNDSLIDSENSFKADKKNKKNKKMSLFLNTFKKSEMSSKMNSQSSLIKNKSYQESNIRNFHLINSNVNALPDDEKIPHQKHKNENIGTFLAKKISMKKNYLKEDENGNEVDPNEIPKNDDSLKSLSKCSITSKESKSFSSSSSSSDNLSKKIIENKSNDSISKDVSNKNSEEPNNSYFIGSKINEEMYPGEEYKIPVREDMLLNKNISLSNYDNKSKIDIFDENQNFFENSKIKMLLDNITISNINDYKKNKEKNEKQLNSESKKNKNKVEFHPYLVQNGNGKEIEEKKSSEIIKKIHLSIEKEVTIEISSLYENIYKLSNYKYYKDKNLQNKVKNLVKKELEPHVFSSLSSTLLNINLLQSNIKINNQSNLKSRKTIAVTNSSNKQRKCFLLLSSKLNSSALINKRKVNDFKKRRSVFIKKDNIKDMLLSDFHRSPSFNNESSHISQNKINNNNINISTNKFTPSLQRKRTHAGFFGQKTNINLKGEFNKTTFAKKEESIHKKRRASIINTINFNIKKTNQNLNNPDELYSNYFQLLLEDQKKTKGKNDNKKMLSSVKINSPKNKNRKDKNKGIKNGFSMWLDT